MSSTRFILERKAGAGRDEIDHGSIPEPAATASDDEPVRRPRRRDRRGCLSRYDCPGMRCAVRLDQAHRYPPLDSSAPLTFAAFAGEYRQAVHPRRERWELSVLPDGRYSMMCAGRCGGVYHRESGDVKRVGDHLVFSPTNPLELLVPRVFLPVNWNRRIYLIPPEKLQEFCDAIIRGEEPRDDGSGGRFYALGLESQVSGLPDLPGEWVGYLCTNLTE